MTLSKPDPAVGVATDSQWWREHLQRVVADKYGVQRAEELGEAIDAMGDRLARVFAVHLAFADDPFLPQGQADDAP